MDRRRAAERIKQIALDEGFDRAGIAELGPSVTGAAFRRWLGDGYQAGMGYLERQTSEREDPRLLLEGARSVLCVALQYSPRPPDEPPEGGDFWPRVARYARGEDYHDFLRRALQRIAARVEREFPATRTRCCVDTSPLLEREWAARSGLGAVGKNTLLLHPEGGSWFLLGEILITLELAPDLPIADLCGECGRCLEACPTGALTAPYRLDSRRCISYWTIEHRGEIPDEMADQLAGWVFGCDLCQEACPWNQEVSPANESRFSTPLHLAGLDLVTLLEMPEDQMRVRLRGTPLLRPKPAGLRRNVRLALAGRPQEDVGGPL